MIAGLAGDSDAYVELLQAVAQRLRAYFARRIGSDCADVEDLVQETLIAMHRRRASYDRALPFTAWLHAVARYKLIDHLRSQGIRGQVPLDPSREFATAGGLEVSLSAADVERLLGELPAEQRRSIRLTRIQGYSIAEAAAMTGRSRSAVKVDVHRGIKRLMARVRGRNDQD